MSEKFIKALKAGLFFFIIFFISASSSVFASDVVINEFSSDTEGTSSNPDWVEIYNSGTENIDLSQYRLRDNTATNKLDLNGILGSNSFISFDWSNKLNKSGDFIKLLLISDESVIDQVAYGDQGNLPAPGIGQSLGRKTDGENEWVLFSSPTKQASNNSSVPVPTSTPTPSPTSAPTPISRPTASVKLSPTIKIVYTNMPLPTYNKASIDNPTSISLITKKPNAIPSSKANTPSPKKLVLGQNEKPTQVQKPEKEIKIASASNNFPKILIGLGSFLIISCAILLFQKFRKGEIENN